MTQIIRIPRDYDGYRCSKCWTLMRRDNKSYQQAKLEHAQCHGWTHCGSKCCGRCQHCGGERSREVY
jgi:hypothetical protein